MTDRWNLDGHQRMLRTIENRVLEDVSIRRAWRVAGVALATALAAMASVWWLEAMGQASQHGASRVPTVAVVAFGGASVVSALALRLRRYRWCCAAAYCCGLAAVIGIGSAPSGGYGPAKHGLGCRGWFLPILTSWRSRWAGSR